MTSDEITSGDFDEMKVENRYNCPVRLEVDFVIVVSGIWTLVLL